MCPIALGNLSGNIYKRVCASPTQNQTLNLGALPGGDPGMSPLNHWRCPSCRSFDVFTWIGAATDAAECGNCGHVFSLASN